MMQIYATEGYKDFPMYFVGGLIVLAVAHLLTHNKRSGWLIDCAVLSVFFVAFGNFGFNSLLWVLWITLIGFLFLRSKPDLKILKVVATNMIVLATLFTLVELGFRLSENPDEHSNLNLGLVVDDQYFIKLSEKDYYKDALELSRSSSSMMSPNAEYLFVVNERIMSSGDFVFLNDFSGSYINIRNGRRVTLGSTGGRQKRVLVFGGSTIFSAEVPDSMTIPSQLQEIFLNNNVDLDVLNLGIPGIRIENQLRILETIGDLGSEDIVVFYDGINDLNTIFRLGLESNQLFIPLGVTKKLIGWFQENSLLSGILISGFIDSKGLDKEFLDSEAETKVADLWIKNDKAARSYVESKGAKFVHILQPN